ncbi:MAG: M12 family metallopeptidase [Culicoidibacterales bacterium]
MEVCQDVTPEALKVCVERSLPVRQKATGLKSRLWKPKQVITISFIGGDSITNKVKFHAKAWLQHASVKFSWVQKDGNIRVSFVPGGSWSYIGTDALLVPKTQSTMNLGWLDIFTPENEFRRVVLHEFGHALGAVHEHQSPSSGIPWNKTVVYEYYTRLGWTRQDIEDNIFKKYDKDSVKSTRYDKLSIMHYPIPNAFTIGNYEVPWNSSISELDKVFMRQVYPF